MEQKPKPSLKIHLLLERCPHCRVANPTLGKVWEAVTTRYDGSATRHWRIYQCTRCAGLISAAALNWEHPVTEMYPSHSEADISIPEKARAYLNQAMDSIQTPAGAVMLAASAVDELLKQKGYKEGQLYPRINNAKENHLITDEMAEWAHQVRLDANDQRHADEEATLPSEQDAQRSVDFALALANLLFVLPSQVTRGLLESKPEDVKIGTQGN